MTPPRITTPTGFTTRTAAPVPTYDRQAKCESCHTRWTWMRREQRAEIKILACPWCAGRLEATTHTLKWKRVDQAPRASAIYASEVAKGWGTTAVRFIERAIGLRGMMTNPSRAWQAACAVTNAKRAAHYALIAQKIRAGKQR